GIAQFAFRGDVEQFLIGNRVPEEERKVRCELEIVDRVGVTSVQSRGEVLAAIQEEGARQHARDGGANSSLEAAVFHTIVVIREKLIHILVGNRAAVGPFRHRRDDLSGADIGGIALVGMAYENAIAARRRADSGSTEWAEKLEGTDAVQPILSAS